MKKIIFQIVSCITVCMFLFMGSQSCWAMVDSFVWTNPTAVEASSSIESNSNNQQANLALESEAAILMDQGSGQVLFEKDAHKQLRPASVTKVMTILLIMEALDSGKITYDTQIPCSENAASMGGSQIWLDVREELSVNDMLKAICVVSANDCTVAMAEYLAGSQEAFVEQMNQKAKELGMQDTTFKNCHGIDEDGHVTSAYDIALMSRELLTKHPAITKYTTIWMDSLRDGKSGLVNTNKLVRNYPGATGLKTGSTSLALYNLSASATRDGLSLIAVIMRAPNSDTRFKDAKKVLDYGFSNYTYKQLAKEGDKVQQVEVQKGVESTVDAIFEADSGKLLKKGEMKNIEQKIELREPFVAPIEKGEILGTAIFTDSSGQESRVNLIASQSIAKISLWNMTTHLYQMWFQLLR